MTTERRRPVESLADVLTTLQAAKFREARKRRFGFLIAPGKVRPMGLVAARMSINPFESFMLFACLLTAIVYTFFGTRPNSIQALMPPWSVRVWGLTLLVGALSCTIGGFTRKALDKSLALYQFGYGLLGTACSIYGAAVLFAFGMSGLMAGVSTLAFGFASWVRVAQVAQFFKLAEALQDASRAHVRRQRWTEGDETDASSG